MGISIIHTLQTLLADSTRPLRLIELGPGKGTLMSDILRVFASVGSAYDRLEQCILIENSPKLKNTQKGILKEHFPLMRFNWLCSVEELLAKDQDDLLTVCISNEFFDALPVYIFRRTEQQQWREMLVDGLDVGDDIEFRMVSSPGPTANSVFFKLDQTIETKAGSWVEVCPEAKRTCEQFADLLARSGGMFITVDYGYTGQLNGPSLRVRNTLEFDNICCFVGNQATPSTTDSFK